MVHIFINAQFGFMHMVIDLEISVTQWKLHTQTLLLQVELPKEERTVVRVSPSLTFPELLSYICEKRNLEVSYHKFDLPVTPESLAGKTIGQLKINSIRVVCTGMCVCVCVCVISLIPRLSRGGGWLQGVWPRGKASVAFVCVNVVMIHLPPPPPPPPPSLLPSIPPATPPSSPQKKRISKRDKNKVQSKQSEKPAEGSPKVTALSAATAQVLIIPFLLADWSACPAPSTCCAAQGSAGADEGAGG